MDELLCHNKNIRDNKKGKVHTFLIPWGSEKNYCIQYEEFKAIVYNKEGTLHPLKILRFQGSKKLKPCKLF